MPLNYNCDCDAYICVDRMTNSYPIRYALDCLEQLEALEEGDRLYIDGLGTLEVIDTINNTYNYGTQTKPYYYKEIGIICFKVL